MQLQSALEAERINHLRSRRENRAIQAVLEETCMQLQALRDENARLREENRGLLAERREALAGIDAPLTRAPSLPLHPFEPDDQSLLITASIARGKPGTPEAEDPADCTARGDSEQPPAAAADADADAAHSAAAPAGLLAVEACGVGLRISETPPLRIAGCAVGGPAHRGGDIRPGDLLLAVDGVPTRGMSPTLVRRRIAGPAGTRVALQLARAAGAGRAAGPGDSGDPDPVYVVTLVRTPSRVWRPPCMGDSGLAAARPSR